MGLADILTFPKTAQELRKWTFCHQAAHLDINSRIQEKFSIPLPMYVLDPVDPKDPISMGIWSYEHQILHSNQNSILGITGNDLLGIDFTNSGILQSWLFLHIVEHQQAAGLLGL